MGARAGPEGGDAVTAGEPGPVSKAMRRGGYEVRLVSPVLGTLDLLVRHEKSGEVWTVPVHPLSWYWFMESTRPVASSAWLYRVLHGDDNQDGGGTGSPSGVGHGGRSGDADGCRCGHAGASAEAADGADVGAAERGRADLPKEGR